MAEDKKRTYKFNSSKKKASLTVGDIEKSTGTKLRAPSNMKASTYLSHQGVPSLGRVLQKVERKLAHNNGQ